VTYLLPEHFVKSEEALQRVWGRAEAEQYTRWLATSHYENFHVVSFLLPKKLHQDFYNIYSFCRWADDLGDEIGDKEESLQLLDWWRRELDRMYAGEAQHPVYVALLPTVQKHDLPIEPFADLIHAFVHDQRITRYPTWSDVFYYCRYSANPVGRLLLYLCGYRDSERQRLSDATCTALQLANFWQDVSIDLDKDRVYIPQEAMAAHNYSYAELFGGVEDARFQAVMKDVVDRARELFLEGLPLARTVDRRLSVDLELFSRGGLLVLEKIEHQDYRVLHKRPAIGKLERVRLLIGTLVRSIFSKAA
jgi:squalene synthase HpnC